MTKYIKMRHFLINSLLTFTFFINSIEGYSQNIQENKCINDFQGDTWISQKFQIFSMRMDIKLEGVAHLAQLLLKD